MHNLANPNAHGRRPVGPATVALTCLTCAAASFAEPGPPEHVNPYPRQVNRIEKAHEWTFKSGPAGWKASHDCRIGARDGRLTITATGGDPYLSSPADVPGGAMLIKLRAKCGTAGQGQFFWTTQARPNANERDSRRFNLRHDGKWHDYDVPVAIKGKLTGLRFDPGSGPGVVEVERIELYRRHLHPLEIVRVASRRDAVSVWVRSHSDSALPVSVGTVSSTVGAGQVAKLDLPLQPGPAFARIPLSLRSGGLSPVTRTLYVQDERRIKEALRYGSGPVEVAIDESGGAFLRLEKKTVATLWPICGRSGGDVKLKPSVTPEGLRLEGDGVRIRIRQAGNELQVAINADKPVECPVLRATGPLEQGLFCGLEYLGEGETSSSKLDIETSDHLRYAPDPLKVTWPLMAVRTKDATVALTWRGEGVQPVFASPNFFDGTDDHRMALRCSPGKEASAVIRLTQPEPIEDAILWSVRQHNLPPLPKAPRPTERQWALCMEAINGPISGKGGWGHCAEPKWGRAPYVDIASTIWRLTGKAPDLPRLQPGGAHVRNDAIYFVTGRADEWLKMRSRQVRGVIARQKADGSFRYDGKYRRGHFEDTSSGHCARPAWELLDFAWCTGDKEALAAGLKTLEYMKRFRTPRGAQTWELSLHTPDILASAYLVAAYVRGYELTGEKEYLALARRWALSGVPFVYLWGEYPIMRYATVPVYGATNWRAPNWMGLPVQWCGGVYAYWLTKLAAYDDALDWNGLAEGILVAGEQMQYPDGPKVGCLPDIFVLAAQQRAGPSINPCALVSLRLAVAGKVDSLAVAAADGRRVCGPLPVVIRDGKAHVRGKAGTTYQVLIDGAEIVTVESKGADAIDLPAAGGRSAGARPSNAGR